VTRHYPVFLDLTGRRVLLVGGGKIALQKAIALAEAGARLTVVAPRVHPEMENVPGVVRILRRKFKPADVKGGAAGPPWLAVAATDDEAANAAVARACAKARVWVNVADRPALCGFILPAVARQGPVTFAVSTGGASPALARFLAGRVGEAFGPQGAALAETLGALRPRLKALGMEARKRLVEGVLARAAAGKFSPEALEAVKQELLDALDRGQGETHGKS
jgi:siroheme synthase-like protein